MFYRLAALICLCVVGFAPFPLAAQVTSIEQPLSDSSLEARAQALFPELRCEVCQGQSLADSNAALASDMRKIIREKISQGATDAEILSFFSERYGDAILMRPPLVPRTMLLWLAPFFLLAIGGILCLAAFTKHTAKA